VRGIAEVSPERAGAETMTLTLVDLGGGRLGVQAADGRIVVKGRVGQWDVFYPYRAADGRLIGVWAA
jgi:hypothetical protein